MYNSNKIISSPAPSMTVIAPAERSAQVMGMVLSGGGAKGAYQAGLLRGLSERGLLTHLDVLSGSSVGALNALFLAERLYEKKTLYQAAGELVEMWQGLKQSDVMNLDLWGLIKHVIFKANSVFSAKPIRELLERYKVPQDRTIGDYRSAGLDLLITGTNLNTGQGEIFPPEQNAISAVLASAAYPAAFPSQNIGKYWYTDGGVLSNTPLKPVIRAGATQIWVIYLSPHPFVTEESGEITAAKDVLQRVMSVMHETLVYQDVRTVKKYNELLGRIFAMNESQEREVLLEAIKFTKTYTGFVKRIIEPIELFPSGSLGGTFDFTGRHIHKLIELGQEDARNYKPKK